MEMSGISWWVGVIAYFILAWCFAGLAALFDAYITRSDYAKSNNIMFALTFGAIWPLALFMTVFVFYIQIMGRWGIAANDARTKRVLAEERENDPKNREMFAK